MPPRVGVGIRIANACATDHTRSSRCPQQNLPEAESPPETEIVKQKRSACVESVVTQDRLTERAGEREEGQPRLGALAGVLWSPPMLLLQIGAM